jgi:hypothetical protein
MARAIGVIAFAAAVAACSGVDETSSSITENGPVATSEAGESVPDDTGGDTSPPEESTPVESPPVEPPSEPPAEESDPEDSTPATAPPDEEPETSAPPGDDAPADDDVVGDAADDDVDPVLITLAVAGFVALLAVAAWWMFRRDDPDADIGHTDPHDWPDDHMSL